MSGNSSFWLTNIRLETGFEPLEDGTVQTTTRLFHLKIEDGKITDKVSADQMLLSEEVKHDAKGLLATPTYKEMHNHLDKTYLSLPWKACTPVKSLAERLQLEALELEELAGTAKQRAGKMIEMILANGSTHIRTHVNIDPYIGLKNLEGIKSALEDYKDQLTYEIVAFPQHGLLRDGVIPLMKEAMRSGADIIGGLDPGGVDRNVEQSLHEVVDLAVQFGAEIDIHLHDGGHLGFYTIDKLTEMTEDANWRHKVAVSHAFCLGDVPVEQASHMADKLHALDISIMSTIPIARPFPPIELLDRKGVSVYLGCDGYYDSWSPFGNGDVLEKVNRYCQLNYRREEQSLVYAMKWATGGTTALDDKGDVQWPLVGDEASFVFMDAACSAEAVARLPHRQAVMFRGKVVSGAL